MSEVAEIIQTVERLEGELADLAIRGLRAVGTEHLASLRGLREEFERIGATHLAGRIGDVIDAIENDDRRGAAALMKAQASLRVFERILTLDVVRGTLQSLIVDEEDVEDEEEP